MQTQALIIKTLIDIQKKNNINYQKIQKLEELNNINNEYIKELIKIIMEFINSFSLISESVEVDDDMNELINILENNTYISENTEYINNNDNHNNINNFNTMQKGKIQLYNSEQLTLL